MLQTQKENGYIVESSNQIRNLTQLIYELEDYLSKVHSEMENVNEKATELFEDIGKLDNSLSSIPEPTNITIQDKLDTCTKLINDLNRTQEETNNHYGELVDHLDSWQKYLVYPKKLINSFNPWKSENDPTIPMDKQLQSIEEQKTSIRKMLDILVDTHDDLKILHDDVKTVILAKEYHHKLSVDGIESTKNFLAKTSRSELISELNQVMEAIGSSFEKIKKSSELVSELNISSTSLSGHMELVGSILSATPDLNHNFEKKYNRFITLKSKFLGQAKLDTFPEEAEAYSKILDIESTLGRIRIAPNLANKHMVAVAGGFSCGKSSFINTLIGEPSHLLPADITPTTSIPTYVCHSKEDKELEIYIFNTNGGRQSLNAQTLRTISYENEEYSGIPFNEIADRIVVYTPELKNYDRITFVDTPGYTSPDKDELMQDEKDVTLREVLSSNFLIWLVDCGKATLTETDITYIKKFLVRGNSSNLDNNKELYIVVNKCDKKPACQYDEIVKHIHGIIEENSIPCSGIGMYSAHYGKWYKVEGKPLNEVLTQINGQLPQFGIREGIQQILNNYVEYHQASSDKCQNRIAELKQLILTLGDSSGNELKIPTNINGFIKELEADNDQHRMHIDAYKSLLKSFVECFDEIQSEL